MYVLSPDELFAAVREDFKEFCEKNPSVNRKALLQHATALLTGLVSRRSETVSLVDLRDSSCLIQASLALFVVHISALSSRASSPADVPPVVH
jgi:hypothetical protein